MKQWLSGIVGASLLSSVAMTLTPQGRVRSVTRLVCGILCALSLVSPLLSADIDRLAVGIAEYEQKAETVTQKAEEEAKMLERTYIEEECAAYILAKATETGAEICGVSVTARWDDEALVWYPWEVSLDGIYSEDFSAAIEAELGIPFQRQSWTEEGGGGE